MARSSIAIRINRLHLAFVRRIDDTHIFAQQSIPLLERVRDELSNSTYRQYRRYFVPTVEPRKTKLQNRTDKELKEIYDRFLSQELYENLIVTAVSQFEAYLFEVLHIIISAHPKKLTLNVKGVEVAREIPLDLLLSASSLSEALAQVIEKRINEISYAAPKDYLEYLHKIAGIDTTDPAFLDYMEIKATRDLLVHNSGIINETYLSNAADKKRGDVRQEVKIDAEYFSLCMATLKRMSGIIQRDTTKTFG